MEGRNSDELNQSETDQPVYRDRSLLYMALVLGFIILVMGYLALFVEDPSKLFSRKDTVQLSRQEQPSVLNESGSMEEEEVKSSLIKFIEAFYYDQRRGYFDPPSYFADITRTFYNYHNLTHKRLKDIYWTRRDDMAKFNTNWIVSSLEFERSDSQITATYWARESYYRKSSKESYSALIKYELIIDEQGKIISLREAEVKDVEIHKALPDSTQKIADPNPVTEVQPAGSPDKMYDQTQVDVAPEYPGGQKELDRYVASAIKYPSAARQAGVHGKVYLSFVVEKDGQLNDIRVKQGLGSGLDEEAIRILKSSGKWKPGLVKESAVRTYYILAINFQL